MSGSSFSTILSNTIISVKYVDNSAWRQKTQYTEQIQQTRMKKSSAMGDASEIQGNVPKGANSASQKYPGNYLIDTYA